MEKKKETWVKVRSIEHPEYGEHWVRLSDLTVYEDEEEYLRSLN